MLSLNEATAEMKVFRKVYFTLDLSPILMNDSYYQLNTIFIHNGAIMKDNVLKAMKEAGKPVRPGDVAKTLGVESKDVSKAIKALKEDGKVISPKRCYYEPA